MGLYNSLWQAWSSAAKVSTANGGAIRAKECFACENRLDRHDPAPATITKLHRIRWIHPNRRKDPVLLFPKPFHLGLDIVLKIIENCGVGRIAAEQGLTDCPTKVIPLLIAEDHFSHRGLVHYFQK